LVVVQVVAVAPVVRLSLDTLLVAGVVEQVVMATPHLFLYCPVKRLLSL
jgi:hypothetical protein